ncbi:hypothetical protein DYQ86_21385 [Acidobacteria bacterium AB60]|nr:hypothetical protein DYQ86_21385 [Acidobacteria bacterium AB60]
MSRSVVLKLAVVLGMACVSPVLAHSQSYYNDEYCDTDYNDCEVIITQVIGDPGISGCDREATISSTLNGQYASDSTVYPTTATVTQQVSNATPGVDYSWTFTETFYYDNPYGRGGCVMSTISWPESVGVALNTFAWAASEPNGFTEYTLSCPNGNDKATCPAQIYDGSQSYKWAEEFLLRGKDAKGNRWCASAGPVAYFNGWPAPMPCR